MIRLATPELRLNLDPSLGCAWKSLWVRSGRRWLPVLLPFRELPGVKRSHGAGAFLMAPWCNRIAGAAFHFRGRRWRLRSNLSDRSAIHGDVFSRAWRVREATSTTFQAALDSRTARNFNFPVPLRFRHRLELKGGTIRCWLSVENLGEDPVPVGMGFHPFFRRAIGAATVSLRLPAKVAYKGGPLPTGQPQRVSGELDLGRGASLKTVSLDRCFGGVPGPAEISWRGLAKVTMGWDSNFSHVYVYSPEKHGGRKARFLCVEPMTHAANAFAAYPKTLKILAPGETWKASWWVTVTSSYRTSRKRS